MGCCGGIAATFPSIRGVFGCARRRGARDRRIRSGVLIGSLLLLPLCFLLLFLCQFALPLLIGVVRFRHGEILSIAKRA